MAAPKKQIKDLRLGDTVYAQNGTGKPWEATVTTIAKDKLIVEATPESFYSFKMTSEDLTRFNFVGHRYSDSNFYLEEADAYKAQRKGLFEDLERKAKELTNATDALLRVKKQIEENDAIIYKKLL